MHLKIVVSREPFELPRGPLAGAVGVLEGPLGAPKALHSATKSVANYAPESGCLSMPLEARGEPRLGFVGALARPSGVARAFYCGTKSVALLCI